MLFIIIMLLLFQINKMKTTPKPMYVCILFYFLLLIKRIYDLL